MSVLATHTSFQKLSDFIEAGSFGVRAAFGGADFRDDAGVEIGPGEVDVLSPVSDPDLIGAFRTADDFDALGHIIGGPDDTVIVLLELGHVFQDKAKAHCFGISATKTAETEYVFNKAQQAQGGLTKFAQPLDEICLKSRRFCLKTVPNRDEYSMTFCAPEVVAHKSPTSGSRKVCKPGGLTSPRNDESDRLAPSPRHEAELGIAGTSRPLELYCTHSNSYAQCLLNTLNARVTGVTFESNNPISFQGFTNSAVIPSALAPGLGSPPIAKALALPISRRPHSSKVSRARHIACASLSQGGAAKLGKEWIFGQLKKRLCLSFQVFNRFFVAAFRHVLSPVVARKYSYALSGGASMTIGSPVLS